MSLLAKRGVSNSGHLDFSAWNGTHDGLYS